MKSLVSLFCFAILTSQFSWSLAQTNANMLCQQYAEESGIPDEELAGYIADCMINLGGIDSEPASSDRAESEEAVSSTSDEESSESWEEYPGDETAAEQAAEDDEEDAAENAEEDFAEDVEEDTAEHTTDNNARENPSDQGAEESGLGATSPFGKLR